MKSPVQEETDELAFFEESLTTIFNDVNVSHGTPGGIYTYTCLSQRVLELRLTMTDSWEEQLKFSHFVWNASQAELNLAKRIESGEINVTGRRVLELGAGAGLCGILSVLTGAKEIILSDYPAESMLKTLQYNIEQTLTAEEQGRAHVRGHLWGSDVQDLLTAGSGGPFDVIILGDCLWMPEQHDSLCQTLAKVLVKNKTSVIYCVAGFHSGRRKLAPFFQVLKRHGLCNKTDIVEIDNLSRTRPWASDGAEMDPIERKRWLVVTELGWPDLTLNSKEQSRGDTTRH